MEESTILEAEGYRKTTEGFGYKDRTQYGYLPVMDGPEWNLFQSLPSVMQARGIVLDPTHPELFNPSEIIAAMNIESALCVARTSDMADDEILFAFDEFRSYMPYLVRNEISHLVIGPGPDGLDEINTREYLTLYFKYNDIVERFKPLAFHYFRYPNNFFNIFLDDTDPLILFITQYVPPPLFNPRWYK